MVDGGTPPLDNVCILTVNVKDINDNEPLFDRAVCSRSTDEKLLFIAERCISKLFHVLQEYEVSVPNDKELRAEVLTVSATDIDEGENAALTFTLEPDEYSPEDVNFFRIDNGQIYLSKSLSSVSELVKRKIRVRRPWSMILGALQLWYFCVS